MLVRLTLRPSLRLLGLAAAACLVSNCATNADPDGLTPRDPRTWVVAQSGPRDHSTIQRAIDAATSGDIVRVGPGRWEERVVVDKPLTLVGAGARETMIVGTTPDGLFTDEQQAQLQQRMLAAGSDEERASILSHALASTSVVWVDADGVTLEALGVRMEGHGEAGTVQRGAAVLLQGDDTRLSGCAIVGSPSSGIGVEGGDIVIDGCLVAAVEATGIAVAPGSGSVEIRNCDVRDAIHRGITIGRDQTLVEGCRISGSSWHGIRYDGVGPTIRNNVITQNKRSGIYASGSTTAQVTDNLFLENGFNGLSAWYANRDTLVRNTFAYNGRSALEVLGASQPALMGNVFAWSPTGVYLGNIGGDSSEPGSQTLSSGELALAGNVFYRCGRDASWASTQDGMVELTRTDHGYLVLDPGFASPQARDFSLAEGSPGLTRGLGATGLPQLASPWPRRPPEVAQLALGPLAEETPEPPLPPAQNPYMVSTPWVEAYELAASQADAEAGEQAVEQVRKAVFSDDPNLVHAGLLAIARLSQAEIDWTSLAPRIRELCGTLDGEAMRRAFYALRVAGPEDGDLDLLMARMDGGQSTPEMSHLLMVYGDGDVSGRVAEQVLRLLATQDADDLREVMRGLWGARVDSAVEARLIEISRTRSEQDCIYFALSTLEDKSPAVIERLFEAARSSNSEVFTRALWGLGHGVPETNAQEVIDGAAALMEETFIPEQRQLAIRREARNLVDEYSTN